MFINSGNGLMISWCIEKLIIDNILPNSCNVQGNISPKI